MLEISVHTDIVALQRRLGRFTKQLPFATALAMTATAKKVQAAEKAALSTLFDDPTPFTLNSIAVKPATKSSGTAHVDVRPVAAAYLEPYEFGGRHYLGEKQGLLVPKDIRVNQYGNLPARAISRLKAQPDIFIGPVKFRSGITINGVWRRPKYGVRRDGTRGTKGNTQRSINGVRTGLQLLIRFEDPLPVQKSWRYRARAKIVISAVAPKELRAAIDRALRTAK